MRGTLTHFNQDSGIGRITSEHGIVDLQVHKSSIDPCRRLHSVGQKADGRVSQIARVSPAFSLSFAAASPGRCSRRNSGVDRE
jgi:cold shock CspA family protein